MVVGPPKPDYHTFVSYFRIFQMSAMAQSSETWLYH